ncbi:MAG TPA: hypothetical protein VKU01_12410 [Bryobacteraceae bacterium]|nr:hypothetical protein [Bryobacteraceae bacterium]
MKLKSYFAVTVEAAMQKARAELGPEAMLITSRKSGPEYRHLGDYEVVFALVPDSESPPAPERLLGAQEIAPPPPVSWVRLSDEVSDLKRQMERLATGLARSTAGLSRIAMRPSLAEAFSHLLEAELDADIAYEIVSRICGQLEKDGDPVNSRGTLGVTQLVNAELLRIIDVDPRIGNGTGCSVVALVGPPGAGKTVTLVKLAVRYGLGTKRPAQILTLDTQRVASAEVLRSYAAIAGIGFQPVETVTALSQALEEFRNKELIFIDTPGLGPGDLEDGRDFAAFLSRRSGIEVHLVVSACMKPADQRRVAAEYEMFAPSRLLFTHLDETATFGPLLSLSARTGKPLSFLGTGQQIPENLEPADRSALLRLLTKASPAVLQALGATAA